MQIKFNNKADHIIIIVNTWQWQWLLVQQRSNILQHYNLIAKTNA